MKKYTRRKKRHGTDGVVIIALVERDINAKAIANTQNLEGSVHGVVNQFTTRRRTTGFLPQMNQWVSEPNDFIKMFELPKKQLKEGRDFTAVCRVTELINDYGVVQGFILKSVIGEVRKKKEHQQEEVKEKLDNYIEGEELI